MGLRGAAAITGFAELRPVRESEASELELQARVAAAALEDAGSHLRSVDGILVTPVSGVAHSSPRIVAELLGLEVGFAELVDIGGASCAGMIWRAAAAISAGMCTTCLCVSAGERRPRDRRKEPAARRPDVRRRPRYRPSPLAEYEVPYGSIGPNEGYAQIAMRYRHEFGLRPEQTARIAVHQRDNAAGHPDAYFRSPITLDDVLGSELICDPIRKLESVAPVAGGAAVIVAAPDRATAGPNSPVWLLGAGEQVTHASLPSMPDLTQSGIAAAADKAFAMAGVGRDEVDMVSLYDCYTITVLATIEDAGFCPKGEGGAFVEGRDLRWSGDFPLNTHGGQLSFGQAGIAGGMSHVIDAVSQLSGRSGVRQVAGAEAAYVHGNGGIMSDHVGLVLGSSR